MFQRLPLRALLVVFLSAIGLLVGCQSAGRQSNATPATTPAPTKPVVAAPIDNEPLRGFHAESYQHVIDVLCRPEMEGRDAGTRGIELARDYLVARFKEAGLEPAFVVDGKPSYTQPLTLKIRPGGRQTEPVEARIENVGGLLPGVGELADEVVIIGAHYDHIGYGHFASRDPDGHGHIHPGADDNASGTAGVVLLADRFARDAAERTSATESRRTILFTGFAGEERGLVGSSYMTSHPDQWAFDPTKVSGMINMDMIGRLRHDEVYAFSHTSGMQWRAWIEKANVPVGLDVKLDSPSAGGSDHMAFIRAGIPAVFFNTWLHEDVHTPNDTPDKINARGSIRVLALVGSVLERAATQPGRITFVAPPPRPFLGAANLTNHDQGALVRGVVDGGPLQMAGVKAGDIISLFNGKAVSNRRVLIRMLRQTKPGDKVKVVLIRDGQAQPELVVTIGKR